MKQNAVETPLNRVATGIKTVVDFEHYPSDGPDLQDEMLKTEVNLILGLKNKMKY